MGRKTKLKRTFYRTPHVKNRKRKIQENCFSRGLEKLLVNPLPIETERFEEEYTKRR